MKDRLIYSSFLVGNIADLATTKFGLALGLSEFAPIASKYVEAGQGGNFFIFKLGLSAMLIAAAAMARESQHKSDFVLNKTVQLSNLSVWGAVAVNTAQILSQLQ